jgi:hypothetical protein
MPQLYDIGLDEHREATQADLDELQRCRTAFGLLVRFLYATNQSVPAALAVDIAQGHVNTADAEARFSQLLRVIK